MTNEQLVIRIKAGIDTADNTLLLWRQNQGYINKIVNRYKNYAEAEDLQQEGFLGLCEGVEHYNPEEGTAFIIYAGYWIRQRIIRYIKGNDIVRLPEYAQDKVYAYKKMSAQWQQETGRKPIDREIMAYLALNYRQLEQLKKNLVMTNMNSLDVPVGDEEDSSRYELIQGVGDISDEVLEKVQQEQLKAVLWPLVDTLPGKQPAVIRGRFQQGKTLKETGMMIGVTLERARTIESNALRELRKPSRSRQLRPFLDDVHNAAMKGTGVERFNQTWTSATERVALQMY